LDKRLVPNRLQRSDGILPVNRSVLPAQRLLACLLAPIAELKKAQALVQTSAWARPGLTRVERVSRPSASPRKEHAGLKAHLIGIHRLANPHPFVSAFWPDEVAVLDELDDRAFQRGIGVNQPRE